VRKGVYFDHTAIVGLLKGNKNLLRIIDEAPAFYTGAHVLALVCGAEEYMREKRFSKERKIPALLSNFKVLEIGKGEAMKAAEIIGSLKAEGKEIMLDEALSAAHVLLNGLVFVTSNRELASKLKKFGIESRVI